MPPTSKMNEASFRVSAKLICVCKAPWIKGSI